jgi:hypothetical protein
MTGNVAQIIAIISHGNYFLQTNDQLENFLSNSSFQFCNRVDFRLVTRKRLFVGGQTSTIAEDPIKWFAYLKTTTCERLRYYYRHSDSAKRLEDYNLAGMVGGGGDWFIEAVYGYGVVLWRSFWSVTAQDANDQKPWSVTYGTDGARNEGKSSKTTITSSATSLSNSLNKAINFASLYGLDGWVPRFEKALEALNSDNPEGDYYHQDLLAGSPSLERRRLFYAAAHAWVFGGMGWWNDNVFESDCQKEFQLVTSKLYDAVNEAYGTVLNS